MTATHNQPRRTRRPAKARRGRGLPSITWGGAGLTLFLLYVAARTWPIQSAVIAVLIAAAVIVRAIRPRRLAPLWTALERISARRRSLPRAGRTLATFQRMSPARFEQAIAELALEHADVHTATAVGQANDRGADVLVDLTDGRRILIQCKHHKPGNNVGSPVVQTINGVYWDIHHCHQAVIVTTAGFTPAAMQTNTLLPRPIRLIDGTQLVAWANGGPAPW